MNLKQEISIMWKFYLMTILLGLQNITGSIFILYLYTLGFSTTTLGIIFASMSIIMILFEIPTGVIADVFGRKISTIISFLILLIQIIIYYFTENKLLIGLAFLIYGFGFTFYSGANDAWRIDYYLHHGNKKYLNRIISRNTLIFNITSFLANILASIILFILEPAYGFINTVKFMLFIKIILLMLSIFVAFITKEPYF